MILFCQLKFRLSYFWSTLIIVIFVNLISCLHVDSLKYEHDLKSYKSSIEVDQTFSVILPLLASTSVLCLFSEKEEFLSVLSKVFREFKIQIFDNILETNFNVCNSIIAFDLYSSRNCFDLVLNLSASAVYILNATPNTNVSDIEGCLQSVSYPEVVVVSLSEGSVYELGPVFPRPRSLKRSSIPDVLKHREQPTKLDLAGTVLTVATMQYIPFFLVKNEGKREYDGVEQHLIDEMSKHFNFSPSYLIYKSWGTVLPNGTWSGQIGAAMQNGLAELAIADFWQIPSLYTILDFGPSLEKIQMGFLVRRPEKVNFQWRSVLTIFKVWVWLATLLSFVLVVTVYWAGVNWDLHSHSESWGGSVMTVFGHLTMSTSHCKVSDGNTRYTLTSWSVFSLLLTTSLSTGIVTRLTLPQYPVRLDTVRQLVEGHHYWTVGYYKQFRENKLMRDSMFNFEDPWVRAFEDSYIYLEPEEILRRVATDSRVTIPVETYGEDVKVLNTPELLEQKALTKFRFCKETTRETHVSMGFKKKSPLLEPLSVLNIRFIEVGLVEEWKKGVRRRWPQYDTSHLSVELDIPTFGEPEPLHLEKVRPVFYLLLFGLAVASLVFVVEISW